MRAVSTRSLLRSRATSALFITLIMLLASRNMAEDSPADEHIYVGVEKCQRCHQRDGIYQSWSKSAHAGAWESLDEKQKKDESCINCHSTGKDVLEQILVGVQCEACHGPGKEHKRLQLAESKKKAQKMGMSYIDEDNCLKCHNNKAPKEFHSREPFDFSEAKVKGVHARSANIEHELKEQ